LIKVDWLAACIALGPMVLDGNAQTLLTNKKQENLD
jgi:hypothetical protein